MKNILTKIKTFVRNESGATAVEYAILLAFIAAAMIVSIRGTGEGARDTLNTIATAINNVVN
jgi:pilus assembly protein Flp/PilA